MWTYKDIDIFPADFNTCGIRWYCRFKGRVLRADTKQGMRRLINAM